MQVTNFSKISHKNGEIQKASPVLNGQTECKNSVASMPIVSPAYFSPSFLGENTPSKIDERMKAERKKRLDAWEDYLLQDESEYSPEDTDYILKNITEGLDKDSDVLPPELDKCILRITMSRYRENPEGFDFRREYQRDTDKLGYKDDGSISPKNHEQDRFTTFLRWDYKMNDPNYHFDEEERDEWLDLYFAKTGYLDKKLSNVYRLPGTKNSYRGQTLSDQDDKTYGNLVESGIKTIVNLSQDNDCDYTQQMAEKHGIEYISFPVHRIIDPKPLYTLEEGEGTQRYLIDKLTTYISAMRKDNVYVCCKNGQNETGKALLINNWFNPDRKLKKACGNFDLLDYVNEMYESLTDEDKAKMGWNKEFEEKFVKKLDEEYLSCAQTYDNKVF